MTTQLKKVAGLIVVMVAVVLIVVFGQKFRSGSPGTAPASPPESSAGPAPSITVKGKIGGEKVELMKYPAVQKILRDTYHLPVEFAKEGSKRHAHENSRGKPVSGLRARRWFGVT